ncbi:hypothetical protein QJS10_CPA06g01155 [Acorus calamus]|uniref:Uncharacterized protein n=1 Tax=Acorus calamus TaxID=4465 RepID=A0AAV9ELM4_ACOCL|nr:hypothetical protein QJS10_CPA06g01155 [Acorus calamus]
MGGDGKVYSLEDVSKHNTLRIAGLSSTASGHSTTVQGLAVLPIGLEFKSWP